MSVETWKPIPGFPDYEVSDMGRVKSLKYGKTCILRPFPSGSKNYPKVALSNNGTISYRFIHQLVMLTFVGLCPDGLEVCHNDDDPQNNQLDNLRYDTHAKNIKEAYSINPVRGLKYLKSLLAIGDGKPPIVSWYDDKLVNVEEIIKTRLEAANAH